MTSNFKKLTFLIPAYKGLAGLELNKKFGISVSSYVDLVLVEDSKEEQMKGFCKQNGIKYFSKENGNGGSVINSAIDNNIIETEGMAIVDVDDTVNIDQLKILISELNSDYDVVFTSSNNIDFNSKKNIDTTNGKGVHSTGLKTSKFYQMTKLPEKVFYTDTFFTAFATGLERKKEIFEISPYNYFHNIPGQSVAGLKSAAQLELKIPSLKISEENFIEGITKNNVKPSKNYTKSRVFCVARAIREIYELTNSKEELFKLKKIYKENYKDKKVAFSEKLIGSKIHRLLNFKRLLKIEGEGMHGKK